MKLSGIILIIIALLVPLYWFVPMTNQHDPVALFSQYLGCFALIAMSVTQVFATRMVGLETIFGGLDRIYIIHKWLGISAMVAILLHDTIDADIRTLGRETILIELAETLGEFSLYGLLILVVITIATFIPYHLWKWTHKLMGTFFAFSAFHFAFILKPFSNTDPVGLYVSAFCIVGILAYIFTLLPERVMRLNKKYRATEVTKQGDAISVTLKPNGRGITHRAGQFAFVSFDLPGLNEVHPFTISSAPDQEKNLRFTFKPLGGYTHALGKTLKKGTTARIQGPFGHFQLKSHKGPSIWLAGGIGITPFLAWAQAIKEYPDLAKGPIHLFYCVKSEGDAAHLADLQTVDQDIPSFHLHLIASNRDGRLNADKIASIVGNISEARAAFCGPEAMRENLRHGLIKHGLRAGRFAYEEFEIRSGLFGMEKAINLVVRKLLSMSPLGQSRSQ